MNQPYYREDHENDDGTVSLDANQEDADWTKSSAGWDLPPYKSPEFMTLVGDLDVFRQSPLYNSAVARGLIVDDEWAADQPDLGEDPQ
jgi:hypothetical protein